MAALEICAIDESTPQLRAPGTGDTYTAPRPLAITGVAGTAALSITGGTQTTDVNFLNLTGTFNNAAVTFTGIKANITDTASAAASLLMDLQVGGAAKFTVLKDGTVFSANGFVTSQVSAQCYIASSTTGLNVGVSKVVVASSTYYGFNSVTNNYSGAEDVKLYRDAANTLALRNSTNAQESRVYGTYTSTSQYHYCSIKTAKTTLTATAGATITATNLIPDGAFLIGVTTRVNTTCTTATGYTVGDGSDADLWGVASAVAAGTATSSADFTAAGACGLYTAAQSVVITATGGNFDGTGAIEVVAHYLTTVAD